MATGERYCRNCERLHGDAKREHWRKWMCTGAPNEAVNPVTGTIEPPYVLCWMINRTGDCWMFKDGPNVLNPREMKEVEPC